MDGLTTDKVPTPRTAALEKTLRAWCGDEAQCLEFAEGLERELIAANARIAKLEGTLLFMAVALRHHQEHTRPLSRTNEALARVKEAMK